jgi:3',5'-cyclic-AMP phosphodiesterase
MKFIHISDLHILPRPQTIRGIDVCARLDAAVASITANFADAELVMVTGDMTDSGDAESYAEARRILDRLPMPWHTLMGNHDGRASHARTVLPHLPWQADGSLQYALETPAGRFIALDSSISGKDSGRLTPARLTWLRDQLNSARAVGTDVYLFMHHVPFDISIDWLDEIKFENGDELWDVLKDFDNIRHMFMGHIHRPTHGSWHGIPYSTVYSTSHQVALQFGREQLHIEENPSYAVVLIKDHHVLVHDHSFLEERRPRTL